MAASVISYLVFFACFGLSFYAISSIQFEKVCSVKNPKKVQILMFLFLFLRLLFLKQFVSV